MWPSIRRRALSSLTPRSGFVFDLDGVVHKGPSLIPGADVAIQKLYDAAKKRPRFPLCFLTNGGGVTEAVKAAQLSALLGVHVTSDQVVMGHTPMRALAPRLADVPVLVVGKGDVGDVALSYGFRKAVTAQALFAAMPSAAPFTARTATPASPCPVKDLGYGTGADPFRAALVFTDPIDWARDLQLMTDVVTSHGVPGQHPDGNEQRVEVFVGHGDLLWSNDFPAPRFGLGAFSLAFQTLYRAYTGRAPSITHYGKPTVTPFKLVEGLLEKQLGGTPGCMEQIFMVGDNPAADIRGARNAGRPWIPVLVQTGVYHPTSNPKGAETAEVIAKDVSSFLHSLL